MEKTIKLTGRIDSSNSAAAEQAINEQLAGFSGDVTLDAGGLDYISSAGLRVILRLKKANPSTRIVNCSPEVYEIFDMTGFTELMEIAKAYRKISVDGCEVIGEGANGKVYRTDPDTIVKVYKNHDALEEIHNERELARKAFVMGIPTAIPYDVVQVGEYYGSVFELLNARSFAKLLGEDGADTEQLAKESVEILKIMHAAQLKPGELPDKKQESFKWCDYVRPHLPEEIGDKLYALFRGVPETLNMLHGDFHVKNIMKQNGENLLIDMDTLAMGHPIYELSAIYMAYVGFSCVDKDQVVKFLGISGEQAADMWKYTLRYYFEGKDDAYLKEIETKAAIICYTRIMRIFMRTGNESDLMKAQIEFCRDYLIKNVPLVSSLGF